jgi:hypothetical protein
MLADAKMWEEIAEVAYEVCTEWEAGFIESIEDRAKAGTLTERQREILIRIYQKACRSEH